MPYIQPDRAKVLDETPLAEVFDADSVGGDLNYSICKLIARFMETRNDGRPRYRHAEDVMGALNGSTGEFMRRFVFPYEDLAIEKGADPFALLASYAKGWRKDLIPKEDRSE